MIFNEQTFALVYHEFRRQGKHNDMASPIKKDLQLLEAIDLLMKAKNDATVPKKADYEKFVVRIAGQKKDRKEVYDQEILDSYEDILSRACLHLYDYAGTWNLKYMHVRKDYINYLDETTEQPMPDLQAFCFDIIRTITDIKFASFPGMVLGEVLGKIHRLAKCQKIPLEKYIDLRMNYENNLYLP